MKEIEDPPRWKFNTEAGTCGYHLKAELLPEGMEALQHRARILSERIVVQEEKIILKEFSTLALLRLRSLIDDELKKR